MAVVRVLLSSFNNGKVRLFVTFESLTQLVSQVDVENDSTGNDEGQGNKQDVLFHLKNPATGTREEHRLSGTGGHNLSALAFKRPKPGDTNAEGIGARWPG